MSNIRKNFKQYFNRKNIKYSFQIIVLTLFFFVQFHQKTFYNIKTIMESFNLNLSNNDIFQILIPCKTMFDLSQFFSITFIMVQLVLCVVTIPLFIFLFVYILNGLVVDNDDNKKVVRYIAVEDHKADYKKISKYLC